MENNIKKFVVCFILVLQLVGCTNNSVPIEERKDLYISFTVTHAISNSEEKFESDVYCYDLYKKQVKKVATVPYTSQYPLTIYDENAGCVYYSGREKSKSIKKDELFQYDLATEKSSKITSSLYAINYLFIKGDNIILGAIGDDNSKALGPKIYNKKTKQLKSLSWKEDDFIDVMSYNPVIDKVVFSSSSLKEQYEKMYKSNENGTPLEGVNNKIYILNDDQCQLEFEVKSSYMKNIVINKDAIYYQCTNTAFENSSGLKKYDLKTKKTVQLDLVIGPGETLYVSENGNDIYYVNNSQLVKFNVETNKKEVLYSVDVTKEAINNAQIIQKD
ncbi:MAG: hypothetical protein RR585_11895 [Coprobacillus sp.]